eukprot:g15368.t1
MRDKQKQVTAFRVQGGSEDRLTAEEFFDRLHKAEHPKKRAGREPLRLQHVFSRCGRSNRFLINLPVKKKLTPQFVEAVAQKELGPGYTATCLDARTNTVKFLPGKRTKTDETYKSVIEEEASTMAEGDCSARQRFVLVAESEKVVYSYDQGKLEKGNPEPRGSHMDFAPPADTAQAILEQRRPGDASCSPRVPAHAPQQAEVPHKSGDSTCWSAANSMAAGTTSRSGGIAAAGADDALPDQPASSDDGAVPGAAGGKRRGPSPDESQATSAPVHTRWVCADAPIDVADDTPGSARRARATGTTGCCVRTQIPMTLAFGITIHKRQGNTLLRCFLDIGRSEKSDGQSFTALSRRRSLENMLLEPFSLERFMNIGGSTSCRGPLGRS